MHPLSSILLLLLVSTSVKGAPTASPVAATSIETIYENVTRTVVHVVTDPTVAKAEIVRLADAKRKVEEIEKKLAVARREAADLEDHTVSAETDAAEPEVDREVPLCSCSVAYRCEAESEKEVDTCMNSCSEHIESYGYDTDAHVDCFLRNKATILEAERCLFNRPDICINGWRGIKYVKETNWTDLNSITYTPSPYASYNSVWKRQEPKYTKIQEFFHCTKHCMHTKLSECTSKNECAIQMPDHDDFEYKMTQCTKDNNKVTNALYATCHCLAWEKGVTELQGSCVYFGNQYYVNRA